MYTRLGEWCVADFDYTSIQATAQSLVTRFGADVVLVAYNQTPGDAAQPWDGPTDPRTGSTTLTVRAVQIEPSSAVRLGLAANVDDLAKRAERILLIAGDNAQDLRAYQEVSDAAGPYKIERVHELNPTGVDRLLWFLELKR